MHLLSELLSQSPQTSSVKKQHRGIEIKSQREIAIMRQAGKIVATVLQEISELVQPGMTTAF
ncbi:MAG TPA: type I methionyl aminopeptidase, partial [Cyanobacteria bacterium UBA9273]|nr:type I methionyl aminopeptidase [Cyanobacteria bacterium UBA9273]